MSESKEYIVPPHRQALHKGCWYNAGDKLPGKPEKETKPFEKERAKNKTEKEKAASKPKKEVKNG